MIICRISLLQVLTVVWCLYCCILLALQQSPLELTRIFSLSPDPSDVELGDVNGDGKLDMVVSVNGPSNTISVFRNTNAGIPASFAAKADYVTAGKNRDIVLADYRNVGRLDISSVMLSTFGISFLKNNTATPPSIGSFYSCIGRKEHMLLSMGHRWQELPRLVLVVYQQATLLQ